MSRHALLPLSSLITMLALTACSGSDATRPSPSEPEPTVAETGGGEELWVAGTPSFALGEGYDEMHGTSRAPGGPWADREVHAEPRLATGQIHRVRVRTVERDPGIQDVGASYLEVVEVLESQPGGPPVIVAPGASLAGIDLLYGESHERREFGPFTVISGPSPSLSFEPREVGAFRIGEHDFAADATVEEITATLTGCERYSARGAAGFRCEGVSVSWGSGGDGVRPDQIMVQPRGVAADRGALVGDWDCCAEGGWTRGGEVEVSRFNGRMELREDGTSSFRVLAPDDNHRMEPGHWRLEHDTLIVGYAARGEGWVGTREARFRVLRQEGDTLELERLPTE